MRLAAILAVLVTAPVWAEAPAHSGVIRTRSMPELSDIALFAIAVAGVWLVRRALRKRFAKTPKD